ncbi:hypothetical protein M8C21_027487 [Ambrosia artemisiifolia]|uniref:Hexosyltransferase n=1 Tax=Ambrosia artemisiifolia TaxID=4212 RepID=A0AAD5GHQ2_AMBAR|nr:hypothetical protein M8C21_027487 [Ambrosia artemisiifolia]
MFCSSSLGNNPDSDISNENKKTNDFLILNDHVEAAEQPIKTKLFFIDALQHWDAEFYVKCPWCHSFKPCEHTSGLYWVYEISRCFLQTVRVTNGMNQSGGNLGIRNHNSDMLSILRAYAHDDVSVGSWFIGLDVNHIDEGKFCCSSWSSGCSSSTPFTDTWVDLSEIKYR